MIKSNIAMTTAQNYFLIMKIQAYQQYLEEFDSWLHRGRRYLLQRIINSQCSENRDKKNDYSILDIGAGSGKNAEILAQVGMVDAVEIEPQACEQLNKNPVVAHLFIEKIPFPLNKKYDLISAMDVLEHIENDQETFNWMFNNLKPKGILLITVPAYQFLFSEHDVALNHFRRYRLKDIIRLNTVRMEILKSSYFNSFLFPIAALSRFYGKLKKKNSASLKKQSSQVPKVFDWLFSKLLFFEAQLITMGFKFPYGLTVLVVFQKNN